MIDKERKIIYVDHSTLSTFAACPEKCRLNYVLGYRPKVMESPLAFGHAYHAAQEAYYDALAGGWRDENNDWHRFDDIKNVDNGADSTLRDFLTSMSTTSPLKHGVAAFIRDLKLSDADLQVALEGPERRSIERGLMLFEAYTVRWENEMYDNILSESGKPFVEISFQVPLFSYRGYRIVYFGRIDRIMRNRLTGRPVIFEIKTTTQALSIFMQQKKPNHQVTGYFFGAWQILPEITESIWDATFVSDRQPNMAKAARADGRFWMYGIDIEKDFSREPTMRSKVDVEEWHEDLVDLSQEYASYLLDSTGDRRWRRNTGSCHSYGGCKYKDARGRPGPCEHHADQNILNSFYEIKKYDPLGVEDGQV